MISFQIGKSLTSSNLKIHTKIAEIFLIMAENFREKESAQLEIISKRKENT